MISVGAQQLGCSAVAPQILIAYQLIDTSVESMILETLCSFPARSQTCNFIPPSSNDCSMTHNVLLRTNNLLNFSCAAVGTMYTCMISSLIALPPWLFLLEFPDKRVVVYFLSL